MSDEEHCWYCDDLTGKAGRDEDSLYFEELGPLCEECFDLLNSIGRLGKEIREREELPHE